MANELARIGFVNARRLLLAAGAVILAVLVAVLWLRSVDDVEVIATLLYVPILLALLFLGVPGGVVAGLLATAAYAALRADAIDAVGAGEFTGLIIGRGMAYLLFGGVGGWAATTLELSLDKLERNDAVDDQTGTGNARALRRQIELERARSGRYGSVFSVSFVDFPASALGAMGRRRRRQLLRDLGGHAEEGARTVDRVAHGFDGAVHRFAAVLPETPRTGAAVFHDRFVGRMQAALAAAGIDEGVRIGGSVCTVPGDEAALEAVLDQWPDPLERDAERPQQLA